MLPFFQTLTDEEGSWIQNTAPCDSYITTWERLLLDPLCLVMFNSKAAQVKLSGQCLSITDPLARTEFVHAAV